MSPESGVWAVTSASLRGPTTSTSVCENAAGGPDETMSADSHASDEPGHDGSVGLHHDTADHGDDGEHDDHAHGEVPLGPIDVRAWGAGLLGIVIGAIIVACFAITTGAL